MQQSEGNWYIKQQPDRTCIVIEQTQKISLVDNYWGPYSSQQEAIAKKIGLIRAGKCQPQ